MINLSFQSRPTALFPLLPSSIYFSSAISSAISVAMPVNLRNITVTEDPSKLACTIILLKIKFSKKAEVHVNPIGCTVFKIFSRKLQTDRHSGRYCRQSDGFDRMGMLDLNAES